MRLAVSRRPNLESMNITRLTTRSLGFSKSTDGYHVSISDQYWSFYLQPFACRRLRLSTWQISSYLTCSTRSLFLRNHPWRSDLLVIYWCREYHPDGRCCARRRRTDLRVNRLVWCVRDRLWRHWHVYPNRRLRSNSCYSPQWKSRRWSPRNLDQSSRLVLHLGETDKRTVGFLQ